ncbi:unnamed protein product [Rotaria sordida]|uniref:Uncharacterized protein n=2 Tax=Rotaria sordida TaxID=392033 RepID=A0A819BE89_9BILA|nr:unnamed protein product [Rotaria sordida]CAF3679469.1 unnamed protein product [Rotaria sordida]CAF3800695.1 unnamed protein product [Rotaria sordida]
MNRTSSGRRPSADPNSIETKYLKSTVGPVLSRGLAEIVERRPNDPIEYLATFLYKQADNIRAQKQKEDNAKQLEIEKQKAKEDEQYRLQLKNEVRALRKHEENQRRQCRRDAEELAKRHKELAAVSPPLPPVHKEDNGVFIVEFGETELHRQAAIQGANLSKLLRKNYHSIASRNAEGKTPRDVAIDADLQENVDQIDIFCVKLLENGNTKAINNLLLCGYTELVDQLKKIENSNNDTFYFISNQIPQLLNNIQKLQQAIKQGNMKTIENIIANHKNIVFYRNSKGSSSLHDAIENLQFHIALYLIQKYPSLVFVKDIRNRTSFDLLNLIDDDDLTDEQLDVYDQLKQSLSSAKAI